MRHLPRFASSSTPMGQRPTGPSYGQKPSRHRPCQTLAISGRRWLPKCHGWPRTRSRRSFGELLRQQRDQLRGWLSTDALGPEELATLAEQIAAHAVGPVSTDLNRQMNELQSQFTQRLHATMQEVVSESVLGPPLANFTGYLTIELDRSSEQDPHVRSDDGLISAGPGHQLKLIMSVVREERAAAVAPLDAGPDGSFLVLEPVVIEGGREAAVTEFDAVADCGTLTPLPRRKSMRVIDDAQASFGFKLPDHDGRHELWFQLYQAGRLLQVIAIAVEVRSDRAAAT
jgi:hypothetical protein